jgi:hypothetical protein
MSEAEDGKSMGEIAKGDRCGRSRREIDEGDREGRSRMELEKGARGVVAAPFGLSKFGFLAKSIYQS